MDVRTPYYHVTMGDERVAQGGEDITPWVNSISVVEDDRQADNVSMTISDPRLIYADALFEGSWVEIDIGYAETNQHALMLRAMITKVELSYPESGIPALTLKGEDKSIVMGLEEKNKRWKDLTVTEIVRQIGTSHGFKKIETQLSPDPLIKSKPLHQDGKTDLAFLQELAKKYHAKCFVELDEQGEEVLYFIPERRIVRLRRPERLELRYRMGALSNLISFSPTFDSSYIDRLKEVADVDHHGKKIQNQEKPQTEIGVWDLDPARMAQANARDREKILHLYEQGAAQKRLLQQKLAARRATVGDVSPDQAEMESTNDSLESRRLGMSASGSTFGNIWVRAKSNVFIDGASERFNGEWYVSNVTHKIDSSGYKTDFKCVR
jgi:Bacteriophage probable baseplate hub protein